MFARLLVPAVVALSLCLGTQTHAEDDLVILPVPNEWHVPMVLDGTSLRMTSVTQPALDCSGDWIAASCLTQTPGPKEVTEYRRTVELFQHDGESWTHRQTITDIPPFREDARSVLKGTFHRDRGALSPAVALSMDGDQLVVFAQEFWAAPLRTYRLTDGVWTLESSFNTKHDPDIAPMRPNVYLKDGLLCVAMAKQFEEGRGRSNIVRLYRKDTEGQWAQLEELRSPSHPMLSHYGSSLDVIDDTLIIGGVAVLSNNKIGLIECRDLSRPGFDLTSSIYPQDPAHLFLGNLALQSVDARIYAVTPDTYQNVRKFCLHVFEQDNEEQWVTKKCLDLTPELKRIDTAELSGSYFDLVVSDDRLVIAASPPQPEMPFVLFHINMNDGNPTFRKTQVFQAKDLHLDYDALSLYRAVTTHRDSVIAFMVATIDRRRYPVLAEFRRVQD